MTYYAHIRDGVVVDSSKWDGPAPSTLNGCDLIEMPESHTEAGHRVPSVGIGWSYTDGEFVGPEPFVRPPLSWDEVRAERDRLLAASDWTQVGDAPVDSAAWAVYRQALRDVPQDFDSPDAVVWPEQP